MLVSRNPASSGEYNPGLLNPSPGTCTLVSGGAFLFLQLLGGNTSTPSTGNSSTGMNKSSPLFHCPPPPLTRRREVILLVGANPISKGATALEEQGSVSPSSISLPTQCLSKFNVYINHVGSLLKQILIQQICNGVWQFIFLTSSQVMPSLCC